MGGTLLALQEYKEAFKCLEKALGIDRQIGFRSGEAATLKKLADWHFQQNQYSEAVDYCEQALDLATELKIPLAQECEDLKQKIEAAQE